MHSISAMAFCNYACVYFLLVFLSPFRILHIKGFTFCNRCSFTDHVEELSKVDPATKDSFLVICQDLASKVLSNANLFLVSVDMPVGNNLDDASGLRLRFSGEILSNSIPCLLTITVEGKCSEPLTLSVKVNCEETVFGLNLLNRVVNFLTEPARS